jgi:hypothetical protein
VATVNDDELKAAVREACNRAADEIRSRMPPPTLVGARLRFLLAQQGEPWHVDGEDDE